MKLVKFNEPVTFSNLLDDFFNNSFAPATEAQRCTIPAVNILDNEKEYAIELAAPGKEKEDFEISLNDDVITISCSKKEDKCECEKDKKYSRHEFCYSNFSRSFTMTEDIEREKIEAKYEGGILTVIMPKKTVDAKSLVKKIDIK